MKLSEVPPQHIRTASDREAIAAGCGWSQKHVDHFMRFARKLRDPTDATKRLRLHRWERDASEQLFGWRNADGTRRFTTMHLWMPKKNGKSLFVCVLGLYFLMAIGDQQPAVRFLSTSGEQIGQMHDEARRLLGDVADPRLRARYGTRFLQYLRITNHLRKIKFSRKLVRGEFTGMAASASGAEGTQGTFVDFDEAHEALRKKPELHGAMRYAGIAHAGSLVIISSTAGDDRASLAYQVYADAKRILDGSVVDVSTLVVIYEAIDQDNYSDAELAAANPAVGEKLRLAELRASHDEARRIRRTYVAFKRYRLGVWCKRASSWMDAAVWDALARPWEEIRPLLAGRDAYVGIDLASLMDLTAAVCVVPLKDGRTAFLPNFWLPNRKIEDRVRDEMDYPAAAAGGSIVLLDADEVDPEHVRAWVESRAAAWGVNVKGCGFDPWRAKLVAGNLEKHGTPCFKIPQGWGISEPSLYWETLIRTGRAVHCGNAVLSWCIGNVEVIADANGKVRPVKDKATQKRIDGVIASIMGENLAMFGMGESGPSPEEVQRQLDMIESLYGKDRD